MPISIHSDRTATAPAESVMTLERSRAASSLLLNAKKALRTNTVVALECIERALCLLELPETGGLARGGLARSQMDQLRQYIDLNLDKALAVADLAAVSRLSIGHFSKAFKVSFGQPPHAYILARRLSRAEEMMKSSDLALSAIALDCGFSDQAHFCRLFRRVAGVSPGAWRRRQSWEWTISSGLSLATRY
ncbi:AraC-like DNA-binding protein [Tardiphaga robiniae]|jgi:AraC-like DNA-binding protein|uniref:helix-turn-helix domain-containing protein n=1 Tax=Tardiphaga robiniae TaxID=943830 RepID=UPI00285C4B4F|nr:AraC-like DNA-binding protein [Tardiphaga robiniae]